MIIMIEKPRRSEIKKLKVWLILSLIEYSSSIKSIAIEKSTKVNLTTKFLNGKMLMFSKVSIKAFVYDLIDVFMFPNEDVQKIYQ